MNHQNYPFRAHRILMTKPEIEFLSVSSFPTPPFYRMLYDHFMTYLRAYSLLVAEKEMEPSFFQCYNTFWMP